MKPRIFIGSSTEGLNIAYATQENLSFDALITVWTQGIFQLSSNSLDDLFTALENFDFGIFVFTPDDISHIRNDKFSVARDNVIFELGMFLGKLGKDRVFFVMPDQVENFHLPTDLLGVLPGKYDAGRADGNLQAALGPFCNQVRARLKTFVYESMSDLVNESKEVKKIAFEKGDFWEMHLSAALLRSRMIEIQDRLKEVQNGHVFKKSVQYTIKEFVKWYQLALSDISKIIEIATKIYLNELEKSFGPPGEPGNIHDVKVVADKIAFLCKDLLAWEIDLQGIKAPDELVQIPKLMQGWSNIIIDEFAKLPGLLEQAFSQENVAKGGVVEIQIVFKAPPNVDEINSIISSVSKKVMNGRLEYE